MTPSSTMLCLLRLKGILDTDTWQFLCLGTKFYDSRNQADAHFRMSVRETSQFQRITLTDLYIKHTRYVEPMAFESSFLKLLKPSGFYKYHQV